MAAGLIPLTELEAVNEILATVSEAPVSTLDTNQVIDASLALSTLRAISVEVQTQGWNWNTEEGWTIEPDQGDEIILPLNTLKVDTVGESASLNCVQRGTRLWNKTDKTYRFTAPVTLDIVLGLDFEELPSTARTFIIIKACRKFANRYGGDQNVSAYTKQDELDARAAMMNEEIESTDPNMLTDSTFVSNLRA